MIPIVNKIQSNRNLLPVKILHSIKYDLITVQKYLEAYKEFILKLSFYVNNISATPGPLAIIDEVTEDLKSLKDFSVEFRKSIEILNSLTSVSLTPLLNEDQEAFSNAILNILSIVKSLVFKTPLVESDIDSKLTINITYFIRNFIDISMISYSKMDDPLNFLLDQFVSLSTLQTLLKSSVSTFKEDLIAWDRKNTYSITLYKAQYIKIMNEDLENIKLKVMKMQDELLFIEDSSRTLNTAKIIDNFEQFSFKHQSKIMSANSSLMWTLNNFADFSEHAVNYWSGTEQETVRTSLETMAVRVFSKFPLTLKCAETFKEDLANNLKLASNDLLQCYNDLLLALPWSFQQFSLEYNLMKAKLDKFLNYGTLAEKYIEMASCKSVKKLLAQFVQNVSDIFFK